MPWFKRAKPDRIEALTDEEELRLHERRLGVQGLAANLQLRKRIANGALVLMLLQIVVANGVFVWYGVTNHWDIPSLAITGWMTATVVQVVSVVLVITNYLFPSPRPRRPRR